MNKCGILAMVSLCSGILSIVWLMIVLYLANYLPTLVPSQAAFVAPLGAVVLAAVSMLSSFLVLMLCHAQPRNPRTTTIAITGMTIALCSLGLTLSLLLLVAVFANG